jgi:UDP-N-acetylmuramoyl-L-alanyl-D-glutamate--2,6-diaminopimelate ligase
MITNLKEILANVKVLEATGTLDLSVGSIHFDSRQVEHGDVFVAVKGVHVDGHQYIDTAIEKGALAVICANIPYGLEGKATFIKVADPSETLGLMASAYFEQPSFKLKVIGVTGTNGKTTTVYLLYQLFSSLGFNAGLLSTIENRIGNQTIKSSHTTADALQINKHLKMMVDQGCEYCFMEVSSHAIDQNRIAGLKFTGAVFTNITHDHLDYHLTFENYIKAKKKFFDQLPETSFALVNVDDKNGMVMLQNTQAKKATSALKNLADFKGKIIENHFDGLEIRINGKDIWSKLVGTFNAYNLLAAYSVAILDGQIEDEVLTTLSSLNPVEGRFQVVPSNLGIVAIVDYAHTPDALKNVLQTVNDVREGMEQVITIIGAGGDRDKLKRPILAKVACQMSDKVILTADNPRTEDPEIILDEMEAGLDVILKRKAVRISNRREAIKAACMIALKGDIILVAGKGHETYQEINGIRHPFDDREILSEFLNTN